MRAAGMPLRLLPIGFLRDAAMGRQERPGLLRVGGVNPDFGLNGPHIANARFENVAHYRAGMPSSSSACRQT